MESLPPYTPIEPFEVLSARIGRDPSQIVKLDANENPYGPLPVVREALGKLDFPHIYPDPESRALRKSLAKFTGVPEEHLLAGSGADELIDLLMRVLLEPNDCILSCPPTFGMYSFDAEFNAARCYRSSAQCQIFHSIWKQFTKLWRLSTENYYLLHHRITPMVHCWMAKVVDELLKLPTLVVLDEAYIEFAGENLGGSLSRIREVPSRENLVVLRTFSKWAGLAGLRIGYGAFPHWLMPTLWKSKQPYNVNVAASVAAQVSLDHVEELSKVVELLKNERERLFQSLQEIPYLNPYPTKSNFILCRVIGRDAAELKSRLAQRTWDLHPLFQ